MSSELVEQVKVRVSGYTKDHFRFSVKHMGHKNAVLPDLDVVTADIIALVEANVARRLLSQDALEAAADILNYHHAPTCDRAITAALAAIGIEPSHE